MPGFEIRAINENDLPEVVPFMLRSIAAIQTPPTKAPAAGSYSVAEFRWLLQEDRLDPDDRIPACEIIRNPDGVVVGMLGYSPQFFRLGERRLVGLGAHNYYVDAGVGMQAFILFKRYMNNPAADFCYSTTCNGNSGPLWKKMGAAELPSSDAEFLLVLRAGRFLEETAHRKGMPVALAAALRPVGWLADRVYRPRRAGRLLKVERSVDWARLAAIAEKCRDPNRLSPERSERDLKRLHDAVSQRSATGGGLDGVYRFSDTSAHEGWFSLRTKIRGKTGRIRSVILNDLVWPRASFEVSDILSAIAQVARTQADLLSVRDFASLGLSAGQLGLRRWPIPAPEGFIVGRPRSSLPPASELAPITDFPEAYGA